MATEQYFNNLVTIIFILLLLLLQPILVFIIGSQAHSPKVSPNHPLNDSVKFISFKCFLVIKCLLKFVLSVSSYYSVIFYSICVKLPRKTTKIGSI